jgi:hypothetical protein
MRWRRDEAACLARLADAVHAVLRLQVALRVPVRRGKQETDKDGH